MPPFPQISGYITYNPAHNGLRAIMMGYNFMFVWAGVGETVFNFYAVRVSPPNGDMRISQLIFSSPPAFYRRTIIKLCIISSYQVPHLLAYFTKQTNCSQSVQSVLINTHFPLKKYTTCNIGARALFFQLQSVTLTSYEYLFSF